MNKLIIFTSMLLLLSGLALAQTNQTEERADPGLMPGNALYGLEQAVEAAEVEIAGIIGGEDMKAKALANNAQERLTEANALADMNQSERAAKAVEDYERTFNKSQDLAERGNNTELSNKIRNISSNNVQALEEVKKKVPEQAQKGIQKAIENSQRRGKPVKTPNNTPGLDNGASGNRPDIGENGKPNISDKRPDAQQGNPGEIGQNQTNMPERNNSLREKPNNSEDKVVPNGSDSNNDSFSEDIPRTRNSLKDENKTGSDQNRQNTDEDGDEVAENLTSGQNPGPV